MDRRRDVILQPGVAQKPNVGLAHFQTVATILNKMKNIYRDFTLMTMTEEVLID